MLKNITSTAAIAAVAATLSAAGPALADAHSMSEDMTDLIRTRDITGGPIYSISSVYNETDWMDTDNASWDAMNWADDYAQIGEIEDVILDKSGQMVGIVAEVGGFLDIGDKHVMLRTDDVRLVPVDDRSYSFVTRMSEEQLEELPSVDEGWWN
ncbi:PRC-barrel domain-containing protein [Jannaschia sp. 2305UL9-9]|uniref:PRC-barrel domain-containing protein n=1 Tax=Jannaschia sp. 2305UL9-9 TaxID=3121638 RepID=UPI003526E16B